jgi:hypothetical protein
MYFLRDGIAGINVSSSSSDEVNQFVLYVLIILKVVPDLQSD